MADAALDLLYNAKDKLANTLSGSDALDSQYSEAKRKIEQAIDEVKELEHLLYQDRIVSEMTQGWDNKDE